MESHDEKRQLDQRARWRRGFYLLAEIDRRTGQLALETSWLPDVPEAEAALSPFGFRRMKDGGFRVECCEVQDAVGILRRATKAITLLLEEATGVL
jgi:hypothetical protein